MPSRPVPLRLTVVVEPQLIALLGTTVGPVIEHAYATPASESETVNCGDVTLLGEDVGTARTTDGVGGAVVSNVYVAVPAGLVLPAASVAVTDSV
jgi:hypothetical protein